MEITFNTNNAEEVKQVLRLINKESSIPKQEPDDTVYDITEVDDNNAITKRGFFNLLNCLKEQSFKINEKDDNTLVIYNDNYLPRGIIVPKSIFNFVNNYLKIHQLYPQFSKCITEKEFYEFSDVTDNDNVVLKITNNYNGIFYYNDFVYQRFVHIMEDAKNRHSKFEDEFPSSDKYAMKQYYIGFSRCLRIGDDNTRKLLSVFENKNKTIKSTQKLKLFDLEI